MTDKEKLGLIAKGAGAKVAFDLKGLPWVSGQGEDRLYDPYTDARDFVDLLKYLNSISVGVLFSQVPGGGRGVMLLGFNDQKPYSIDVEIESGSDEQQALCDAFIEYLKRGEK